MSCKKICNYPVTNFQNRIPNMKKIYLIWIYALLPVGCLFAQERVDSLVPLPLNIAGDSLFSYSQAEILHDAIVLPDGRIALVGETFVKTKKADRQGLLLLYDPLTESLERHEFGGLSDDVLLSVALADDATLYAVGYRKLGPGFGEQGWIVRWDDWAGKVTFDTVVGGPKNDRFEKIIWLDNGVGVIAGTKGDLQTGYIWFNTIIGRRLKAVEKQIGEGLVEDIAYMAPGPDNYLWLCGNIRKKEAKKEADGWILLLDENGTLHRHWKQGDALGAISISAATTSFQRDLLLSGRIWVGDSGRPRSWAAFLDETSKNAEPRHFKELIADDASAVCAMPFDSFLVAVRRPKAYQLLVVSKDGSPQAGCAIEGFNAQEKLLLLRTSQFGYLVAGTALDKNFNQPSMRIVALEPMPPPGRKDLEPPKLRYFDLKLLEPNDDTPDGLVAPGELASLSVRIENADATDILSNGVVSVEMETNNPDFIAPRPLNLPILLKGKSQVLKIPLRVAGGAASKSIKINIVVRFGSQTALTIPYTIQIQKESVSYTPRGTGGANIIYRKPDVRAGGSRVLEADERNYRIEIDILSANGKLSADDPVIYKNNIRQIDQKAQRTIGKPVPEGELFAYRFTYDMALNDGPNVIRFQVDDYHSDSIVVNYTAYKPDLHVLLIGVPYPQNDLKYTVKDARDLAMAWARQKGRFFNNVYIDTLVTSEQTGATAISGAFEGLKARYDKKDYPRKIKSRDYVIVCISSHGIIRSDGHFGLVAYGYNSDLQQTTSVDYQDVLDKFFSKIQCKRFIFIDACHSGGGLGAKAPTESELHEAQRRAYEASRGMTVFMSSSKEEFSYEYPAGQNGVFTEALLEALSGKPVTLLSGEVLPVDNPEIDRDPKGKGIITIAELRAFMYKRIPDLLVRSGQSAFQTPEVMLNDQLDTLPVFSID